VLENGDVHREWDFWHHRWIVITLAEPDQDSLQQAEDAVDNPWGEDGW